jgi:hypothetical protein
MGQEPEKDMATCRFCGQQFENSQGVRAHLKGCVAYRQRPRKQNGSSNLTLGNAVPRDEASLGTALGSPEPRENCLTDSRPHTETDYDEVTALQRRLAAEKLRLQLRGVEEAHSELDEQAELKAAERKQQTEQQSRAAEVAQREREDAHQRSEHSRHERERREKMEQEKAARRRATIQQVKCDATLFWWPDVPDATALKSSVFCAIERELASLAVDEIPHEELVLIAQGIRDKLTREAMRTKDAAKALSQNREKLIQHGIRYGERELNAVDDLGALEKWRIRECIKEGLSDIRGDETTSQIEDLVEEILESEGLGWDDDEEDEYEED